MTIKHFEFGRLLQAKLNSTKDYTVESIARRTGTPPSTIYKYCEGVMVTPAEFISKLYNATSEIEFLDFIIGDTDKILIDQQRGEGNKSIADETLDVVAIVGRLAQSIQKAQHKASEGGVKISYGESRVIYKHLNMIIKEAEDVRTSVENMAEEAP